jgi:HTH-type transcriptional regulator, competence development regulator
MKLNLDKDWYIKRAQQDDKAEVSAGSFNLCVFEDSSAEARAANPTLVEQENSRPAFGKLINLLRRRRGLNMEELAMKARIDLAELIAIEQDFHYIPEPRTVLQLAKVLGLPNDRMLQLSGNKAVRDSHFSEEAVRFAARSESLEKLSKDEQVALEEFVKYLSASTL